MKEHKVENISEYLDVINSITEEWDEEELWFRGVCDINHKLLPSLYRGTRAIENDEEQEIYIQFVRKAKAYIFDYNKLKDIDWYILMQHYSFPTRLLDWTSGSLIALYFAVRNANGRQNRCVYVIDPFDLNKCFHNLEEVPCSDECSPKDYALVSSYLPKEKLPNYPIAIEPPYIDRRVVAQKSCFTIHGSARQSFEELFANKKMNIAKIIINNLDVNGIKQELTSAGISESILFPDLEGLARELIFHYMIE